MTEDDYLEALSERWPRGGTETRDDTLQLVEEAIAAFPLSARLWCARGDLIQLSSGEAPYTLDDARASYEHALAIDPDDCEALQELGHFHYIDDNNALAEESFLRAIARGATMHAFLRLAELYLEEGRATEACDLLSPIRCPYHDDAEVSSLRTQAAEAGKS
jgi:tetratricopeptide (TPR) repeat protein